MAAPAQPPFEDLLDAIDHMDGPTLRAFIGALRERYNLEAPHVVTVIDPKITMTPEQIERWIAEWRKYSRSEGWA